MPHTVRSIAVAATVLLGISAAATAQAPPPADNGGVQVNIPPPAAPETKPPVDLTPPREGPIERAPAPTGTDGDTSTSPLPPPAASDENQPPRGEGAAAIPAQTPWGVQAIEDWVKSWFE
jgi:hypothetical protein